MINEGSIVFKIKNIIQTGSMKCIYTKLNEYILFKVVSNFPISDFAI